MSRIATVLLIYAALFLASSMASAATFAVGTCQPKLPHFPTITQAVNTVPAGSVIKVCPGTYPEQILIQKSINLQGIVNGNSTGPVITVPQPGANSPGLVVNVVSQVSSILQVGNVPFAAQILVQSPTPVFISDITVDGTGGNMNCSSSNIWLAGIFYTGGSSGNLNHVTTRNQLDQGCGAGLWIEDTAGPGQNVSVQTNSVHDFDFAGIFAGTLGTDQWLTTLIRNNFVFGGAGNGIGIISAFVTTTVQGNVVTGTTTGIFNLSSAPLATISNNEIADSGTGITTGFDFGTIFHNQISNVFTGIDVQTFDATVTGNGITNSIIGIEFECNNAAVYSNTINDATTALDNIPFGFALIDHYYNVDNVALQCGLGAKVKGKASHLIRIPGRSNTR
jgi:nitrous oxidase accessory protein NosD